MDIKQLNGHASQTLTAQPNFAADGQYAVPFPPSSLLSPSCDCFRSSNSCLTVNLGDLFPDRMWLEVSLSELLSKLFDRLIDQLELYYGIPSLKATIGAPATSVQFEF